MVKISKRFESERDALQVTLEEVEAALEQEEVKFERSLAEVVDAKDEMERRLTEKDEEFKSLRYAALIHLKLHNNNQFPGNIN